MNFFRSEEHLRNWAGFSTDKEDGIISVADLIAWFSADLMRKRLDLDYVSHIRGYWAGFAAKLREIGKGGPYWSR